MRAFTIANKIAEIYMREGTAGKERESREAFDFIDKQVKEYGEKLSDSHEKVLAYYRHESDGPATPAPSVPGHPRPKINPEELAALKAEETTLAAQLAHKPATSPRADSRQSEDQYRARTIQLQADLDRLLTTFTEMHPDVKRVRRELATAKAELHRAEQARVDRDTVAESAAAQDDEVYRAARDQLEKVRTKIAALEGVVRRRPPGAARVPVSEAKIDPELHGVGQDATLSELVQRYQSTSEIYRDLLKRRDNASLSMVLDAEHRGLSMRLQEAAELPVNASSLRLLHLSMIGLILATLAPLGFLFALVRLDQRVRTCTGNARAASSRS